jgi:hypothetical protein
LIWPGRGLPRFSRAWYCSFKACVTRWVHVMQLSTTDQGFDKSTVMMTAAVLIDFAGRKNAGKGIGVGICMLGHMAARAQRLLRTCLVCVDEPTLSFAESAWDTASSPGSSHTQAVSLLSPGFVFLMHQKSTNAEPACERSPFPTALCIIVVFPHRFCPTTYTYDSRASE